MFAKPKITGFELMAGMGERGRREGERGRREGEEGGETREEEEKIWLPGQFDEVCLPFLFCTQKC